MKFLSKSGEEGFFCSLKCNLGFRCLLAARIEYFRCMLGSEWLEVTQHRGTADRPTVLRMPFHSDVVRLLRHYVYTDELLSSVKERTDTDVPDLLCRLLVCADQLLAERLKELCQSSIAETSMYFFEKSF